jgi:hypothetical protein
MHGLCCFCSKTKSAPFVRYCLCACWITLSELLFSTSCTAVHLAIDHLLTAGAAVHALSICFHFQLVSHCHAHADCAATTTETTLLLLLLLLSLPQVTAFSFTVPAASSRRATSTAIGTLRATCCRVSNPRQIGINVSLYTSCKSMPG